MLGRCWLLSVAFWVVVRSQDLCPQRCSSRRPTFASVCALPTISSLEFPRARESCESCGRARDSSRETPRDRRPETAGPFVVTSDIEPHSKHPKTDYARTTLLPVFFSSWAFILRCAPHPLHYVALRRMRCCAKRLGVGPAKKRTGRVFVLDRAKERAVSPTSTTSRRRGLERVPLRSSRDPVATEDYPSFERRHRRRQVTQENVACGRTVLGGTVGKRRPSDRCLAPSHWRRPPKATKARGDFDAGFY